jgi:hypothetical protein
VPAQTSENELMRTMARGKRMKNESNTSTQRDGKLDLNQRFKASYPHDKMLREVPVDRRQEER